MRVTVGSFHELGRRESRCLTSRCDARTVCLRSMRSSLWRRFTPAPAMQISWAAGSCLQYADCCVDAAMLFCALEHACSLP